MICTFENNSKLDDEEQRLQEEEGDDDTDFDASISHYDAHASSATTSVYNHPEQQSFIIGERTHREDWPHIQPHRIAKRSSVFR